LIFLLSGIIFTYGKQMELKMSLSLAQVEEQVFTLPQDEQLQLVNDVLAKQSLSKIEEAQLDVAEQRAQELASGKVAPVSSDDAFKMFRSKLKS
jgi:Putative addiction module component